MPQRKNDSPSSDGTHLVASLLARIDQLLAQLAARDERIDELLAQVKALNVRIAELEAKLGGPPKTPDNSSLPPSRGQKANAEPPAVKPRRKGRPGVARKLAEKPDATRRFYAEQCACGAMLVEAGQELAKKRLTEVCQGLFGLTISQGAIANVLSRVGEAIAAPAERIAAEVRASEVIASDETSARVKGKTWWQWTFGCATAVYHVIAPTRGKCVPTDFLAGVEPKMWLSDRLPAQLRHAEEHQFCLAHLIRDAQYAIDHGDTIFAPDFKALLKDACAVGRRRPNLADATIAAHRRRLERQLERLLARKPTNAEGRKLRDAVYLDCSDKLFVFLKRRDAEPTNNESERALRPSVIFRKVTNGFRSEWGAKTYAALCSIVETGRRNGRSALTAIRDALAPAAAVAGARPAHAG